jgi:hypothetical protein
MTFNRSLTSALMAIALVATGGFAHAQATAPSGTSPGAPGELNQRGTAQMKIPSTTPTAPAAPAAQVPVQVQAQPQPAAAPSAPMSTSTPATTTAAVRAPRADRN